MANVATPPAFTEGVLVAPVGGVLLADTPAAAEVLPHNFVIIVISAGGGRVTFRWRDQAGADKWVQNIVVVANGMFVYIHDPNFSLVQQVGDHFLLQTETVFVGAVQGTLLFT